MTIANLSPTPATSAGRASLLAAIALSIPFSAGAAQPSAQPIVDSERAFARAAEERGTRAAFLEYLADSAVRLLPRPTPGRAATEAGASPGAPLRWTPDLASISGGGDLGWTSGPFLAYRTLSSEPPAAAGHYLTIWRREEGGAWRVVLDGGVTHPIDEARAAQYLDVAPRLRPAGSGRGRNSDCSAAFTAHWQQQGRAAALKEYLAEDARLLVAGAPVVDGRKAWLSADSLRNAVLDKLRPARSLHSDSGDVEVSYGEYDVAARLDAPRRHYVYVHIWDVDGRCQLALEMLNPAQ